MLSIFLPFSCILSSACICLLPFVFSLNCRLSGVQLVSCSWTMKPALCLELRGATIDKEYNF